MVRIHILKISPLNYMICMFLILTVELHDLYVLNTHTNFYVNWILFTIRSIDLSFMHYFKLQKLEFKQLIDDMTINIRSS